ncbi:MAG TPA: hypothetical protein VI821_00080 [Candidatus Paceibacterota bacterium]
MNAKPNKDLYVACKNGDVNAVNIAITRNATDWNWGLYGACEGGQVELSNMMIARGATDWNWGLYGACYGGHVAIVKMMIEHGATHWNGGLYNACCGGHVALANMMIGLGATDWDAAYYGSRNMKEYVKAQWKLHDAKAAPIFRMLRKYKRSRNAKRIQRWWRGTYPLWRELAYAPPNGIRYRQSLEHFTQILNILKTKI